MAKTPKSKVGAERARLFKASNFNPIRGITPAKLVNHLDAFDRGELRPAVLLWQKIMERDDQVKTCHPKRTRNVTGLDWEILTIDESPEADTHKEALENFYNNLTAFHGLNENERGGLRLLLKHMMTAVGLRYACFEIIWQPGAADGLTAQFKFLPLQFFENTTGRLRFLETDSAVIGVELDDFFGAGNWMIATGEGIMEASSVAWMFKNLPLKAWVTYSEKFGIPGLHGKTNSAKGSPEWDALVEALRGFGEDLALVTNEGASILPIELKSSGNQPHPPLVERMDRALSRLWFGGDLATMAKGGDAVGSQPQSDDLAKLQEDDAAMITDTLQHYVDRPVIDMLFGVAPLAYFKLKPPARIDVERELKVDQGLIALGVEASVSSLRERYGRAEPEEGEKLAGIPKPPPPPAGADPSAPPNQTVPETPNPKLETAAKAAANEARTGKIAGAARESLFLQRASAELSAAERTALQPVLARVAALQAVPDAQFPAALAAFQADLPALQASVLAEPGLAAAWERTIGTALVSGFAEHAAATRPKPETRNP